MKTTKFNMNKKSNQNINAFSSEKLSNKESNKIVGGGGDGTVVIDINSTPDPNDPTITSNRGGFAVSGRNNA